MTRYDVFEQLKELCSLKKSSETQYNKMIQSGGLVDTHHDYGRGYYDVSISYVGHGGHFCRVWFGTIDDGDYGSWTECKSKEDACILIEKVANKFKDVVVLPTHEKLNEMFFELGVYFCQE